MISERDIEVIRTDGSKLAGFLALQPFSKTAELFAELTDLVNERRDANIAQAKNAIVNLKLRHDYLTTPRWQENVTKLLSAISMMQGE